MLGLSYGELFLLIGATAAVIGPKDLPRIARVAGRFVGRSVGYVQMARGQFDTIMEQSQAKQLHKEVQDLTAQMQAMRHQMRISSFVNPGPLTRSPMDNIWQTLETNGNTEPDKPNEGPLSTATSKVYTTTTSVASPSLNMHSQATAYARLAETGNNDVMSELTDESGLTVLPVSAESTGYLPNRKADANGSDIMLESILEAKVARDAKDFFAQPHDVTKSE